MKRFVFLAFFLVATLLFSFNTAFTGIFDKNEASVSGETKAKIEKKAKIAFASETLSRIQKSPTSRVHLVAQVTSLKITKVIRDRPASIAGGFYYVEGKITVQLRSANDVIDGQKVWARKGQIFFTEDSWFRCAAVANEYGDILRITNMQLFKENPSE